jgi:hypothetical protein
VKRICRAGGGRKPLSETDAILLDDLRRLVEPETRGDPQAPLLWTCKSAQAQPKPARHGVIRSGAPWSANSCAVPPRPQGNRIWNSLGALGRILQFILPGRG